MAKQVSNVLIRLGIENFEGIEKLKSAFRELDRSIGPTSRSIDAAIAAVKSYASESTRSEQLIRGQIEAFKGLRSQVDVGGRQYTQLSSEINKLQSELRGSTDAVERQREALLRNAGAGKQNADALQRQITSLERLRQQTRPGSSAFLQLGQDIEKATAALGRFRSEVSQAASTITQMPGASFEKVANQVAILQRRMQSLNFTSAEFLDYQRRITLINLAQSSPVGRQQVRAAAAIYEDPLYQRFVRGREEKLPLPATPAGYQQRIGEIEAEIQNVSNLQRRRELTLELDKLNRQLKATIIDATSAEQRAVDVVRARVNAQRELLSRSGFGAFSSDIRGRGFKAEQQRTSISDIQSAFSNIQQAREVMEASVQAAARRTVQQELSAAQRIEESDQRVHAARMERKRQEFEAEVKAFDALLQSRNIESVIEKRKRTLQGEIGIPTTRDLSPFYENVVGLGTAAPRRSQQFMGRAPQQVLGDIMYQASAGKILDPVNQDLKTFNTLSDLSTNSIGELSTALGTLKANLRPVDVGYKQLSASIERNERIIEDTLRKRENTQRQRLGGRQLAQISGAAISGGIFGGVEGFLGGVAGGIFGGVGGSFAGAAAGAQVGMLRQQLAGTADYAAQIGKLQIALRGVSGSQANYNQALSAAAAATRELNVPQEAALQGITRLSAAVLGAGGTIGDANFAFRAISESIKATGGNAEQVDGALLALTQVFSKGKVSAEELNQIAERLPGTFTLFAQATGKTGPELQKSLQQGQVGLNDLMKFLELASQKNQQTALAIAGSSEEAGARMTIAFQKMALEVGNALKPIGAELQNAFASFGTQITPQVTEAAKGIGGLLKVIIDNGEAIGVIAKLAVQFGIATYALKAFTALQGPMTAALQAIALQFGALNAQTVAAEARLKAFAATARAAAASLRAPLVLTAVIIGADIVISKLRDIEEARKNIARIREAPSAAEWVKRAGGSALSAQDLTGMANKLARDYDTAKKILAPLEEKRQAYAQSLGYKNAPGRLEAEMLKAQQDQGDPLAVGFNAFAKQYEEAKRRVNQIESYYQYLIGIIPNAPTQRRTAGGSFPSPTSNTDKEKAARDRAAADAQRTAETLTQQQIRLDDTVFNHRQELARLEYDLRKELLDLETQNRLDQLSSVEREAASAFEQRRQRETQYRDRIREAEAGLAKAQQDLLSAQRMATVTAGAASGKAGLPPGMTGYITGDPSSPYYQADHGGANYHEHAAFADRATAEAAYKILTNAGIKVTEFLGRTPVGGHSPGSAHYGGLAFDVPASQVPVGQEPALTARVKRLLGIGGAGGGALQRRGLVDTGDVGVAQANVSRAQQILSQLQKGEAAYAAASYTKQVNDLTKAFKDQNDELNKSIKNETLRADLQSKGYSQAYVKLQLDLADALDRRNKTIAQTPLVEKATIDSINSAYERTVELLTQVYNLNESLGNSVGFREGAQRYVESIGTMREATASLTQQGFKGLEDVIVQLTTTGTANFQAFAASILEQTARMIIQQLVLKTIMQALGAIGGGPDSSFATLMAGVNKYSANANGNVFAANGIVPYAMGGIVTRPTLFPFAKGGAIGTGLMGEAGPEAIIPLSRGANGKLGIAGGGGTTNVVVNVDASGNAQVQGREDTANQLGRVISQAVQAELVKQKRPGGLLA